MTSKKEFTIDFGLVLFLVLFPHLVPLPFYSYSIVCLTVLVLFLKRRKKTLRDLGLQKGGVTLRTIAVGVLSAIIWVAFMRWIYAPTISALFEVPDYTEYDFIRNNISNLVITMVAAWLVGGFYEELVFRGFINSTVEKYSRSFWLSALITSSLFGAYHWQQGKFGVLAAFLGGLYWSLIYWYTKRNLWASILSHALFDSMTLVLIYLGMFG